MTEIGFLAMLFALSVLPAGAQTDWPTYGYDLEGTRYSPLDQINKENVTSLERVWTYDMAPPPSEEPEAEPAVGRGGRGGRGRGSARSGRNWGVTPLVVGDMMYLTTAYSRVIALKPETGEEIWTYEFPRGSLATRGLEYWAGDDETEPRVFVGTSSGRLLALNARTGEPALGFGDNGVVELRTEAMLNGFPDGRLGLSSPPIVYRNLIITGANVQESPSLGPAGDTRAWDVHTGELVWTFHSIPRPGEEGHETWEGDDWESRSGTNVWGMMTIDAERGIVYMPYGEPTTDYWGGDRPGANLYGSALVAADALTGERKWYFQAVHHDTWDYDLAAPPVLFDINRGGETIPAVAEITKMGLLFIFNRETGEPVFGIEERSVPTDDALPGDEAWPTQPFPLKPPALTRNSFGPDDLADVTPEHQEFCEALFNSVEGGMHHGGPYTHYSTTPSIIFPSSIGGGNWNPPSYDPTLGYLFVNTMDFGSMNQMVEGDDGSYRRSGYEGTNRFWDPETNMPCNKPPWGRLFAIDVSTGDIAWESVLGITDTLPADKQKTGRPMLGGSMATAGGLVFIGATDDSRFRAFDSANGDELWVTRIDAGSHSAPITYQGEDGKQYVVVTATGGGFVGDRSSADAIIAFALPAEEGEQ